MTLDPSTGRDYSRVNRFLTTDQAVLRRHFQVPYDPLSSFVFMKGSELKADPSFRIGTGYRRVKIPLSKQALIQHRQVELDGESHLG